MGRLTLRLPETLHQKLVALAEEEGVSLNHYIVYALTQQVTVTHTVRPVPKAEREQQEASYAALLQSLGSASFDQVRMALNERQPVYPEPALTADVVQRLRDRIARADEQAGEQRTSLNYMTVGQSRDSGLTGLWKDREDIEDSAAYVRTLREKPQNDE